MVILIFHGFLFRVLSIGRKQRTSDMLFEFQPPTTISTNHKKPNIKKGEMNSLPECQIFESQSKPLLVPLGTHHNQRCNVGFDSNFGDNQQ